MPASAASLWSSLRSAIGDDRVIAALAATPRELFVPPALRDRAYENAPLPIGAGQTISQPLVVARMCALLAIEPGQLVLDVGTGSGWHAGVLATLGAHVLSIERDARLSAVAARALREAGVTGVELYVGDGFAGLPQRAPYDAINVAAAAPWNAVVALEHQLADHGRLVVPLENHEQRLVLSCREGHHLYRRALEPVRFVPLLHGVVDESPGPSPG